MYILNSFKNFITRSIGTPARLAACLIRMIDRLSLPNSGAMSFWKSWIACALCASALLFKEAKYFAISEGETKSPLRDAGISSVVLFAAPANRQLPDVD